MDKLSLRKITDSFAAWAFLAIVGYGNYQLQKISDGLNVLTAQMAAQATATTNHGDRLNEQSSAIQNNTRRINDHDGRIGRIEGRLRIDR